ncbi:MAG TPA: hypothetical protein EYQ21_07175 [Flavobacteriales bacterium]|nr:hypothetical protein [Flavobacteriales bacterium]
MKESEYKVSNIIRKLASLYEAYNHSGDNVYLQMGIPLAKKLMYFGKDVYLDKEIHLIDSFMEACTEHSLI